MEGFALFLTSNPTKQNPASSYGFMVPWSNTVKYVINCKTKTKEKMSNGILRTLTLTVAAEVQ
jgi:hypothetical protein